MVAARHRFGVRDARGVVPPAPRLYGESEDGGRLFLELAAQPRVRRVPRKTRDDETSVTYITDIGDGPELAEKIKTRLEKEYGGTVQIETRIERTEDLGAGSIRCEPVHDALAAVRRKARPGVRPGGAGR